MVRSTSSRAMLLILVLAALTALSNAHHMMTSITINGVNQGDGACLRIPKNTDPFMDVSSNDMACNIGGGNKVTKTCAASAGASVTVQWRTWPDGSHNDPIDVSHQGPCSVYMKKMGNNGTGTAAGSGWFKIWNDGVVNGQFCTDRLRKNNGTMTLKIPQDIEGGYYLFRAEHLALHEAKDIGGAQWYMGCAQLFVYSTGGTYKPQTVSIPGYVKATDPGVHFDYWNNMHPTNYQIPGPAPITTTQSGGGQVKVQSFNKGYSECIVSNGNWCGVSVPSFKNEDECYSSTEQCWNQASTCYSSAQATGDAGCREWENVCTSYQDHCSSCEDNNSCSGTFPPFNPSKSYRN